MGTVGHHFLADNSHTDIHGVFAGAMSAHPYGTKGQRLCRIDINSAERYVRQDLPRRRRFDRAWGRCRARPGCRGTRSRPFCDGPADFG